MFYIDTQELAGSLGAHLHEHEVGFLSEGQLVSCNLTQQRLLQSPCWPTCMRMRSSSSALMPSGRSCKNSCWALSLPKCSPPHQVQVVGPR